MNIVAVFLPSDPEGTVFDAVQSVDIAVRQGCLLYINRHDNRMAFLPRKPALLAKGWVPFGQHREVIACAPLCS